MKSGRVALYLTTKLAAALLVAACIGTSATGQKRRKDVPQAPLPFRADELLNRTKDRIEETSDAVHRTVISPVRQLSGIIQGLTAGLEFLLGGERRRRHDVSVPQDEMFI